MWCGASLYYAGVWPPLGPICTGLAAHSTINTALNYLHWVQWTKIFAPVLHSTICAEQCKAQFALHRNICNTIMHCIKNVTQKMDRPGKEENMKLWWTALNLSEKYWQCILGRLYKLFTIWLQCGSKTCSALADSFKLFQCSWWMEVPTLLRHSSFIIRIILQPPYSLSP